MLKISRYLATGVLFVMMAGCASVGKKYNYQNVNSLRLGISNQEEAKSLIGAPLKSTTTTNADGTYEILQYTYAYANLGGAKARVLLLEFKNGVLNGYVYNSGFSEDSTAFVIGGADKVNRGSSTKADVLGFLGEPSGKAMCPSTLADFKDIAGASGEVWAWIHTTKSKGLDTSTIKTRTVKVAFDEGGVVTNIETSEEH